MEVKKRAGLDSWGRFAEEDVGHHDPSRSEGLSRILPTVFQGTQGEQHREQFHLPSPRPLPHETCVGGYLPACLISRKVEDSTFEALCFNSLFPVVFVFWGGYNDIHKWGHDSRHGFLSSGHREVQDQGAGQ